MRTNYERKNYQDPKCPSISEDLILQALRKGPQTAAALKGILSANPANPARYRGTSSKLPAVFIYRLRKKGFPIVTLTKKPAPAVYILDEKLLPAIEETTCKAAPP